MKRVASLYLPDWSIDRLRRAEPALAPSPERPRTAGDAAPCDSPGTTGWRPGARWAREARAEVARIVPHQHPPLRETGRRSEAAAHPYKRLPGDDGSKSSGWPEPVTLPSSRHRGDEAHSDRLAAKGPSATGPHEKQVAAFFDTGRATAGTVARACKNDRITATGHVARTGDGVPLVTVTRAGGRIEVAAVSAAARALGIAPGMALTQVRAATPDVVVRDADERGDARDLRRLAIALARRWSPCVAVADAHSLFLDLSGVAHLHGGEARMARRIVRLLARIGITARIGIGDTTGAAWACAHHAAGDRDGVTILPPGEALDALVMLPVAALRLDDHAVELLQRLGIDRVGQLAALPRAPLARRLGRAVAERLDQASGRVAEPLDPVVPPVAIVVEQRFAEPLLTAEPIAYWIGQLVKQLADRLAQAGRGVRSLVLAATRVDAAVQTIRIGFARPTRAPDHLLRLLVRRIDRMDPGFGIEALALHVQRSDPLEATAFDGDLADDEPADLAPLVDAIVNRIGERRLWRDRAMESDVPERSVGGTAPLDQAMREAPALRHDDVRRLDARPPDHPWHPRWPRPARLLRRPELVDNVLSGLPDQPPRRFTWRGVTYLIVRGDGPERIAGEWWRRPGEREAVRDYYQVEDQEGHRYWLFRRGDGECPATGDLSWYMHGTFG